MQEFTILNEDNLTEFSRKFVRGDNFINISSFRRLEKTIFPKSSAIKFVLEGEEIYHVNNRKHSVRKNEYLLLNPDSACEIEINSKSDVRGICIDVNNRLLADVSKTLLSSENFDKSGFDHFIISDAFFQNKYSVSQTITGKFLESIRGPIEQNPLLCAELTHEFYFELAEKIVLDQYSTFRQFSSIPAAKSSTRREILLRLYKGREFMDQMYTKKIDIAEIALASGLSEYHFYRLFKKAFRITPYRYLLEKRLQKAFEMLGSSRHQVLDVALTVGFTDISSFSKSFKKRFGKSPSEIAGFDK